MVDKEWWEDGAGFFGKLYKEADDSLDSFFEGASTIEQRTNREVEGVIKLCHLKEGDKLIDCPCGYARHSVALAEKGISVTGVDISTEHLELANRLANTKKQNITFIKHDMRTLSDLGLKVDVVINMFYSFGFFDDENNLKTLKSFYDSLVPGGRFLMHTMVTVPAFSDGRIKLEERRKLKSGKTLVSRRRYNHVTRREEGIWSLIDKDKEVSSMTPYDVRIYSEQEFVEICYKCGFKKVTTYGDWDGSKYIENSMYLIVVAEK